MDSSCLQIKRIGLTLSQRIEMGIEIKERRRMVLCRARPRRVNFLAPKACPQMGSMPMARPERME